MLPTDARRAAAGGGRDLAACAARCAAFVPALLWCAKSSDLIVHDKCVVGIDPSVEPILWRCERVVWIGWRHGCDGSAGKGFRLLPDELMRCIVRQLRPVGRLEVDLSRSQASV